LLEAAYGLARENVLHRADAEPSELESANFDLSEKVGDLINVICADTNSETLIGDVSALR